MTTLMQRIDRALATLANEPPVTLDRAVEAVFAGGHAIGVRRDALRLMVRLRLAGEPLLEGVAGTFQRACERAREARLPPPTIGDLRRIAAQEHPESSEDDVRDALEVLALHLGLEAERLASEAAALHVERIRRGAH
jgi:hypothetical protein